MNWNGICLVVGDDLDIRGLLCLILSSDSFKVHAEATGAAGLQAARAPDPTHQEILGSPHPHDHRVHGPRRGMDLLATGVVAYLTKSLRLARLVEPAQQLRPQVPAAQPTTGQVRS
jgi:hypothetical protein